MTFTLWAQRWNIPQEALTELRYLFGTADLPTDNSYNAQSETDVSNLIKMEASRKGTRLFRNNVGAAHTNDGRFFRFGLANETAQMNEVIKSGDLIGIKPIVITIHMVGQVVGQFISREIKRPGWKFRGTGREPAQLKWIELIQSFGGDACFATGEGTL